MVLTEKERKRRARWWLVAQFHYYRVFRKADPSLSFRELLKLSREHTHSWVWGYIGYHDYWMLGRGSMFNHRN